MRQVATAEVCVGMRKPEQFSVLLPSTAGFERALPVQSAICCCPSRSQAILASKPRASGECRFKRGWIDVPTGSINGPAVRNKLEQVNRGRKCVVYQNLPSATPESQVAARPAASRLGISRLNQRFWACAHYTLCVV
jgi:hypothetical protein